LVHDDCSAGVSTGLAPTGSAGVAEVMRNLLAEFDLTMG
jgi:hypothetical protein